MNDYDSVSEFIDRMNSIIRELEERVSCARQRGDSSIAVDAYYSAKADIKDEFNFTGRRLSDG